MKYNKLLTAIIACSVIGSATAAPIAQWATQISAEKSGLITELDSPIANNNHEAVSFSYKLDASEQLNFESKPFVENSRQFWLDSTGEKLAQGITLSVTGGETVIRISPLSTQKSLQLSADLIEIENNGVKTKVNVFADSQELKAAGAPFSDGSIALTIKAQAGQLNLKVNTTTGTMPFVVHVLEKDSPFVLALNANKTSYNANQKISINTTMLNAEKSIAADLQGYISRPDGSVLGELQFEQNEKGGFSANLDAIGAQGMAQGLWEVHVFAKGEKFMRDAQTSFAVNLNTAQFSNDLSLTANQLKVGVNVGLEGRYEVRGVLMGTNANGDLQPIAMTMTADWLKAGNNAINLKLDKKLIKESGLSAPFTLKNVQLTNQTYLAPVQTIRAGIILRDFSFDEDFREREGSNNLR